MFRRRSSTFAVCLFLTACGGKVETDTGGGGAGGSSQASGGGPGGGGHEAGGSTGAGGATGTGGSEAAGQAGIGGQGGAPTPCGNLLCPPGAVCCDPSCGFCVPPDTFCPAFACGGDGGASGTGGAAGGCGTYGECKDTFVDVCPSGVECLCKTCLCESARCRSSFGCPEIYRCLVASGCGPGELCSPNCAMLAMAFPPKSLDLALQLNQCSGKLGCDNMCGREVVDAGPACFVPPPAAGAPSCAGQFSSDGSCYQQCKDGMNDYVVKCVNGTCNCFFNGQLTCTCASASAPGACGSCCPPWK